jgi:hypothetical protein
MLNGALGQISYQKNEKEAKNKATGFINYLKSKYQVYRAC